MVFYNLYIVRKYTKAFQIQKSNAQLFDNLSQL